MAACVVGCAALSGCGARDERQPRAPHAESTRPYYWPAVLLPNSCDYRRQPDFVVMKSASCGFTPREVRTWGATPREGPPAARCPTRVRVFGDRVVAEPVVFDRAFDALPFEECVPREYLTGARHVLEVDDGWLVAYEGAFGSELSWASADGLEKKVLSRARVLGFARAPSGGVLALAQGKARLGRGAVVRLEHGGRGEWTPKLVAVLPIEPSGGVFDDGGVIVGFAQGFVFRVDEAGQLENVHYVARDIGRVTSIARGVRGVYFLGLECGVLRVDTSEHTEEWWSARDGASGRWSSCGS
jgi:hypothetical protein